MTARRQTKRQRLDAARRVRMGVVGLLECCRCEYPLKQYVTTTRHAAECPSHSMTLSAMRVHGDDHYALTWTKSGKID